MVVAGTDSGLSETLSRQDWSHFHAGKREYLENIWFGSSGSKVGMGAAVVLEGGMGGKLQMILLNWRKRRNVMME